MVNTLFPLAPDWTLFYSTFFIIFLAELPDKTAFAILILASRNRPLAVYIGVCFAFFIQNIVAVLFGSLMWLLPPKVIHVTSGILFLIFAFLIWKKPQIEENEKKITSQGSFFKIAWISFGVIFIAEWGDLTQLATATLVAKTHQPITIFLAATSALWTTTALAVIIGHNAKKVIQPHVLQTIASIAFATVGFLLLSGFWDK